MVQFAFLLHWKVSLGPEGLAQVMGCLRSIPGALGLMVHTCDLNSQEVEIGSGVQGLAQLHCEFKANRAP